MSPLVPADVSLSPFLSARLFSSHAIIAEAFGVWTISALTHELRPISMGTIWSLPDLPSETQSPRRFCASSTRDPDRFEPKLSVINPKGQPAPPMARREVLVWNSLINHPSEPLRSGGVAFSAFACLCLDLMREQ
jgi:hypothetical protein